MSTVVTNGIKPKQILELHLRVHKNENPVLCPIKGCRKYYQDHYRLRNHIYEHSKEDLVCDWEGCAFKCKIPKDLRKHKAMCPFIGTESYVQLARVWQTV